MKRLGLSIYPDKTSEEEIYTYLDKMSNAGFSRIFSCLLSVDGTPQEIKEKFCRINKYAHDLGYEVILDVAPRIFDNLGISYKDLSFFKEVGADGIRLDQGFTGLEESIMTYNPQGLKIEINMSNDVDFLNTIMGYKPNTNNLIGCHNFYPHAYSGLSLEFFENCTHRFKKFGINTAAFVTSQAADTFGPWPVSNGLPTLEMHRDMPIDLQIEHFISMGTIDDVIISNCYPSDEEIESIKSLRKDLLSLSANLVDGLDETMKSIVLDELHFNRGDVSENFIRSTQSRVKYKGHNFELFNAPEVIHKGDIIIESSLYGHYAGELQIARSEMKNSGMSNVVGCVPESEFFLLDSIEPWQKFCFREGK